MIDTLDFLDKRYALELGMGRKSPIFVESGRLDLARLFFSLGYKIGAEIGVEEGVYSAELCENNPDLKLFCIDPWKPYFRHGQRKTDRYYKTAVEALANYNCDIIREYSMDAVKDFEDGSLDFVYIDGGHDWKNIVNDIVEWEQKVRIGGIVSGHDFKRQNPLPSRYINHVKDTVQAYTRALGISPWFVLRGDKVPSWFWVRE